MENLVTWETRGLSTKLAAKVPVASIAIISDFLKSQTKSSLLQYGVEKRALELVEE